jgi:hypothetical protein
MIALETNPRMKQNMRRIALEMIDPTASDIVSRHFRELGNANSSGN